MCGLVGVFGDINLKERQAFSFLLWLDVYRGKDSTGVLVVNNTKPHLNYNGGDDNWKTEVDKQLGTPDVLFENSDLFDPKDWVLRRTNARLVMGHNRFATSGDIDIDGAHPFEINNIIGAHNGTLDVKESFSKEEQEKWGVDSQMLFDRLSQVGAKEMYANTHGPMALTWYDKDEDSFNILRNYQRPLFCCYTENYGALLYASEQWMLVSAFNRMDMKMSPEGMLKFGEHRHYKLNYDKRRVYLEYKEYEPAVKKYSAYTGNNNNYGFKGDNKPRPEVKGKASNISDLRTERGKKLIEDIKNSHDYAMGPGALIFPKKIWEDKIHRQGGRCAHCLDKKITWGVKNNVLWLNSSTCCCSDECAEALRGVLATIKKENQEKKQDAN